jgi:hypothetical protein
MAVANHMRWGWNKSFGRGIELLEHDFGKIEHPHSAKTMLKKYDADMSDSIRRNRAYRIRAIQGTNR